MIVYYTKYKVVESFDTSSLLALAFDSVKGMKNAPDCFKMIAIDSEESGEWRDNNNLLAFEIDTDKKQSAFRVAIVDDNGELWTTDVALNDINHEIQLRLAREKNIVSAEYDKSFNLPYIFKRIIREGFGGMDDDLPVIDKPIFIDEHNISLIAELINGLKKYSMPIIYVTHPFDCEYMLDVNELAKDMAGSAHVLVEKSPDVAYELKSLTQCKNPYNGAVEIFYEDDSIRYLRRSDITANQFRYKISHAAYARMAMRNIDDDCSLSSLRIRNKIKKLEDTHTEAILLSFEIEKIKEQRRSDAELIESVSEEIKEYEKRISELEIKVDVLTDALNRKNKQAGNSFAIEYNEKQFYEDESKRMLLESVKKTLSTYGPEEKERRDYHLLTDIISSNNASEIGDNIKNDMLGILRKQNLSKLDVRSLLDLGFELQQGSHDKYLFHGDDRYILTVSKTPSDYRGAENMAHEAKNLIFGRT